METQEELVSKAEAEMKRFQNEIKALKNEIQNTRYNFFSIYSLVC